MNTEESFLRELYRLCVKHQVELAADDPYCPLIAYHGGEEFYIFGVDIREDEETNLEQKGPRP